MLQGSSYSAFAIAAYNGRIDVLGYLCNKAESLNIQSAVLEAKGYVAFKVADESGHTDVLDYLWRKAKAFKGAQRAMLYKPSQITRQIIHRANVFDRTFRNILNKFRYSIFE
ncbi:MAG: hypothetical protein ACR5LB_11550 [Wolbachia sp.]